MSIALLVIGNGRLNYLHEVVDTALDMLPAMDHYLMVDDSGSRDVRRELDRTYPDFTIQHHDQNLGMARAVQTGFDLVLTTDADHVFWLEEDMLLTVPPPVNEAINALCVLPQLAQVLFQRQPLTPEEHAAGTVVGAMNPTWVGGTNLWIHQHIFSLNPCVIPRWVLELGWSPDNESGMTRKLLDAGYWFGVWDGQYVQHVGDMRGKQWQL